MRRRDGRPGAQLEATDIPANPLLRGKGLWLIFLFEFYNRFGVIPRVIPRHEGVNRGRHKQGK